MSLPHCDPLFEKFLARWYSPSDQKRKHFEATRPDIMYVDSLVGIPASEIAVIDPDGERESAARIARMLDACRTDWPTYLSLSGEIDEHWIAAFDDYYDPDRIADVISKSAPDDFSNDYLVLVCEFGAAIGHVLQMKQPRLIWLYDWPYWESSLVDTRSGAIVPTFHWAVKKFSEYGVDDGFAEKIEMCLRVIEEKHG